MKRILEGKWLLIIGLFVIGSIIMWTGITNYSALGLIGGVLISMSTILVEGQYE